MDVPKAPEFMGVLLGRLICAGVFTLNEVGNLLQVAGESRGEVREEGYALRIFGAMVDTYREEKGEEQMVDAYKRSDLDVENFVSPSEKNRETALQQFLERTNLHKLHPVRKRLLLFRVDSGLKIIATLSFMSVGLYRINLFCSSILFARTWS